MSLQALWSLFMVYPGQLLNALALFFALTGGWLLLVTRAREQRATARLLVSYKLDELTEPLFDCDEPTARLNRFFYRFGAVSLSAALVLSWLSTRL